RADQPDCDGGWTAFRDPRGRQDRRRRRRNQDSEVTRQASSSIGRAAVSKTAGWGFDSLLACHRIDVNEELKVQNAGGADTARLVVAVVLVIGGIAAFYVLDTVPTLVRWLAVVAGLVLGIGAVATSAYGRAVI